MDQTQSDAPIPENTEQYNNLVLEANNENLADGDPGWISSSYYATKGIGTSMVNSFINTGVDVGNWFGADWKQADTYQDLLDGGDKFAAEYYADHKDALDLAGFVAGSLVPGFSGIKVLNAAKRGTGLLPTVLGVFSNPREKLIQQTLNALKNDAPNIDSLVRMNKLKAVAYGFGDQAIQAAAWETAVVATMGAAPTLDNKDWKDIAFNMGTGILVGGALGGIWDAFGAVGSFKKAQIAADVARRPNEATTNLGKGAFLPGDRVVTLLESLNNIPLPPTEAAGKVVKETYDKAIKVGKIELGKIAPDPEVANALLDKFLQQRELGAITEDDLFDNLSAAVGIERITADDAVSKTTFYVRNSVDPKTGEFIGPITHEPTAAKAQAYALRDEQIKPRIVSAATVDTATEAFQNGADIFIDATGNPIVNKNAPNIVRSLKPGFSNVAKTEGAPLIFNLRDGSVSTTAVQVLGDLGPVGEKALSGDKKVLTVAGRTFTNTPANYETQLYGPDYLEANARYVWAGRRGLQEGDKFNINDLSMMDALARQKDAGTLTPEVIASVTVRDSTGQGMPLEKYLAQNPKLSDTIEELKRANILEYAEKAYEGKLGDNGLPLGDDIRKLAARFNVPKEWLDNGMPKTNSLNDISVNPEEWAKPNSAKVIYSVGNPVKDADGMIARAMPALLGRINRAKDLAQSTWMNFAGELDALFPQVDVRFSQMRADSLGSGPTALGFNNPNYNTLGELYSAVGSQVHQMKLAAIEKARDAMAPHVLAVTNNSKAAAELGTLTNILRASPEKYILVPGSNYLVLRQLAEHVQLVPLLDAEGNQTVRMGFKDTAKGLLPEDAFGNQYLLRIAGDQGAEILPKGKYAAYHLSEDVHDFLEASTNLNDIRLQHDSNFRAAQGITKKIELGSVYAPPINTNKYNFWALVREPQGNGASSSSVASITAANAGDLAQKIAKAEAQGYEVFTKNDIKLHHQVLGDYDYNMNMSENLVDSNLQRKGILSEFFPETDAAKILPDWTEWHDRQETRLLRNMVELKYAQQFAELRDLGQKYIDIATSRTGKVSAFTGKTAENPYDDYIKTALDLSKTSEYRLWSDANEKVEAFFDSAFSTAKQMFSKALDGQQSFEDANNIAQKFGMGKPFVNVADYMESRGMLAPTPYLRNYIQKVNSLMSIATLSLDAMNSLINTISTPILLGHEVSSLRQYYGTPEGLKALSDLTHTPLPDGSGIQIPSTVKLLFNAVTHYWSDAGDATLKRYSAAGLELTLAQERRAMVGQLAFAADDSEKTLSTRFANAVSIGVAKGEFITGNKFAEQFTRYVSANVMDQVCDALSVSDPGVRLAMLRTFVNRVQGNYVASQRPIAFQGVLGQAIGLFQTYQFNMMQQVFRSMENGDTKSLAILFGLQGTIYGLNGLPLFSALNTHIVGNASGNPSHTDITTAVPRLVGKSMGDFIMYGGASWFTNAALYSRGDINPRQLTVLPILPQDYPAINGITSFVKNLVNVGAKLNDGGNFVNTMLEGLEHNSLSRPLAGLAQVVQGYSTTNAGKLIARTSEVNAISNAARIFGAKPLDEGIALDAAYRMNAYKAKDNQRINILGEALRTQLRAGQEPTDEVINEFITKYAASGGNTTTFNKFFVDNLKNSNQSFINQITKKLNSPLARNLQTVMGGEQLPDYSNMLPQTTTNPTPNTETEEY